MTIKYIKNILDREAHNNINENFKVIGESIDQLDTSVGYDLAAFENANAVYGPYLYDELADTTPMYES